MTGLPVALTMGEPAGVGGELSLAAWLARRDGEAAFFAIDDPDRLDALARRLGRSVPLRSISSPAEAPQVFAAALPVLPLRLPVPVAPGRPDPANAAAVLRSIERAVVLVRQGSAGAMVTNPIHKGTLYKAGFRHPGHTEYLAALAGAEAAPVMMLTCPGLRVVPVTVHLPLSQAIAALSSAAIVHAGRTTATALVRDFGIAQPRLAVAGLNPHAGENGALGNEESDIIAPAVAALREAGLSVVGPLPADTLFHAAARRRHDAVICMYHDQALIPLKTIDFARGVNVTLGLPFVRTSPDHGTAFDIAGTGRADPASLLAALDLAADMARRHRDAARPAVA